jgi:hypothetical protein
LIFGLALRVFGLLRLHSAHLDYVGPLLSQSSLGSSPPIPILQLSPRARK